MGSIDWPVLLDPLDTNESWNLFIYKFKQFIHLTVPKRNPDRNRINAYI